MKTLLLSSLLLALTWASSNPQHNEHHKNSRHGPQCLIGEHHVAVEKLTGEQLAGIKTEEAVKALDQACLDALSPQQYAQLPDEFYNTVLVSSGGAKLRLALLVNAAKKQASLLDKISNPRSVIEILDLAAQDADANRDAVRLLFSDVSKLGLEVFSHLLSSHLALLDPSVFAQMTPEMFAQIPPESLATISYEQFLALSPAAKLKMTPTQASSFPSDSQLDPALIAKLKESKVNFADLLDDFPKHPCLVVAQYSSQFEQSIMEILRARCANYCHINNQIH